MRPSQFSKQKYYSSIVSPKENLNEKDELINKYKKNILYLSKSVHELKNVFLTISSVVEDQTPKDDSISLSSNIKNKYIPTDYTQDVLNIPIEEKMTFLRSLCNYGKFLINDINLISKINPLQNNSMYSLSKTEISEFNITDAIDFCVKIFQVKAKCEQKNLTIRLSINFPYTKTSTAISETKFKQVIINLLSNAYKFTPCGEIIVSAFLYEEKLIRISVKDNGVGFDMIEFENIGKEYQQYKKNQKHNKDGTGLGISIIMEILSLFNSKLQFKSVIKKGSIFWFDLIDTCPYNETIDPGKIMTDSLRKILDEINSGKKDNLCEDSKCNQLLKCNMSESKKNNNIIDISNITTTMNINNSSKKRFSDLSSESKDYEKKFNNGKNPKIFINGSNINDFNISIEKKKNSVQSNNVYSFNKYSISIADHKDKIKNSSPLKRESNFKNNIIFSNILTKKNRNSEKIGNNLLDVIQKNIIKKSNMSVNKKKHEKSKSQFFKSNKDKTQFLNISPEKTSLSIINSSNNSINISTHNTFITLNGESLRLSLIQKKLENKRRSYNIEKHDKFDSGPFDPANNLLSVKNVLERRKEYQQLNVKSLEKSVTVYNSLDSNKKNYCKKEYDPKKINLIICDDEYINAHSSSNLIKNYFKNNLKEFGLVPKIYFAENGIHCLYLLNKFYSGGKNISFILIDENMPFLTGSEVCKIIKKIKEFKSVYVFLLSSDDLLEHKNCKSVDGFCFKPLTNRSLVKIINKVIPKRYLRK